MDGQADKWRDEWMDEWSGCIIVSNDKHLILLCQKKNKKTINSMHINNKKKE